MRSIGAVALSLSLAVTGARAQTSSESDAYIWLQYGADGHPHVRAIPSDRAACPTVTADQIGVVMTVQVVAAAGFDRVLCDAPLAQTAQRVRVGTVSLPPLPQRIERFIVLGDTGCRVTAGDIANCHDARAWPFARIAQTIARETPRPDLIVHVGNYQDRDSACPPGDQRCAGSPFGDNWTTWAVDFFEPGAPLFATAPLVFVRGDHEACARAGLGWTRYLAPQPDLVCRVHEPPTSARFTNLQIVDADSAQAAETNPDPAVFEQDERSADRMGNGLQTLLVTHQPPFALAAHATPDANSPHLAAIIAGHPNLFAALTFAGAPPMVVVGTGGDTLATSAVPEVEAESHGSAEARFGYAVFDRVPGGWSIGERDPDGSEHRRCELRDRTVHCLNGG